MKKPVSIKVVFLVSFASIFLVCIFVLVSLLAYRQVRKFINNRNYEQCLIEQKVVDEIALSYIPIIKQVVMSQTDILVKGIIKNPNIKRLDAINENDCIRRVIKYDSNTGAFSAEAYFDPQVGSCGGFSNKLGGARFMFNITPKDSSNICTVPPNLVGANTDVTRNCSLNRIVLYTSVIDQKWCLEGDIDIGLGSAPIGGLSDAELQAIGLTKNNICQDTGLNLRSEKCSNANGVTNLTVKFP